MSKVSKKNIQRCVKQLEVLAEKAERGHLDAARLFFEVLDKVSVLTVKGGHG